LNQKFSTQIDDKNINLHNAVVKLCTQAKSNKADVLADFEEFVGDLLELKVLN
jgi:hypothetical protein